MIYHISIKFRNDFYVVKVRRGSNSSEVIFKAAHPSMSLVTALAEMYLASIRAPSDRALIQGKDELVKSIGAKVWPETWLG